MKKAKLILIIFIITSILFITKLFAEETVSIKSIELDYISESAIEKSTPTIDGLGINLDVEFREVDNYIKYKLIIKNDTEKEYDLDEDTGFLNSDYVTYKYYTEGKIKAKSENIVYLVVSYNKEVEENKIVENEYIEQNKAVLEIVDDTGEIVKNPKTGNDNITFIILSVSLIVSCSILFIMKKNELNKTTFIFIVLLINCMPLIINATQLLKIELNVNVLIRTGGYHVIYEPYSLYNQYIDVSLLEDYEIIDNECKYVYINNQKENPNFVTCANSIVLKSKKKYFAGDTIELIQIKERRIQSNLAEMYVEENKNLYYELREYELFYDIDYNSFWEYAKIYIEQAGYTYFENDIEIMQFSNIGVNYWDEQNWPYVSINIPSTFKMPEHDVYFEYVYPM